MDHGVHSNAVLGSVIKRW